MTRIHKKSRDELGLNRVLYERLPAEENSIFTAQRKINELFVFSNSRRRRKGDVSYFYCIVRVLNNGFAKSAFSLIQTT